MSETYVKSKVETPSQLEYYNIDYIKKERERFEREYQFKTIYEHNDNTLENTSETKISTPGKFFACKIYALWYYGSYAEGFSDLPLTANQSSILKFGEGDAIFIVRDEERKVFPELGDTKIVHCYEDENGFFYCEPFEKS